MSAPLISIHLGAANDLVRGTFLAHDEPPTGDQMAVGPHRSTIGRTHVPMPMADDACAAAASLATVARGSPMRRNCRRSPWGDAVSHLRRASPWCVTVLGVSSENRMGA
jgi:hypothetical protein